MYVASFSQPSTSPWLSELLISALTWPCCLIMHLCLLLYRWNHNDALTCGWGLTVPHEEEGMTDDSEWKCFFNDYQEESILFIILYLHQNVGEITQISVWEAEDHLVGEVLPTKTLIKEKI